MRIPSAACQPVGWAISATNEHPVESIKYFDFWFSQQGRILSNFGVEGLTYEMVDGKPQFKKEILDNKDPVNAQLWAVGAAIPRGYWMDYEYERQWTNKIALEGIDMYDKCNCLKDEFMGVSLNAEEKATFDRYWPSILTYMTEMQQTRILGARGRRCRLGCLQEAPHGTRLRRGHQDDAIGL